MTQTASNYGIVLYEMGVSKDIVDKTRRIFSLTQELHKILLSPLVTSGEKHRLIERIFPKEVQNFLKVLCDYQSVDLLEDIFQAYESYYEIQNQILHANLYYAIPPTDEQKKGIENYLKKKYGAKEVQLELEERAELLGGFILRVRDIEEDWSMEGRLKKLEQSLIWR